MTLVAASFKGSSPTDLRFNRVNNDYVLMGRAHVVTLLPLARPSYSGMVVIDVDGPANINGTGTNTAANYINIVDADGNIVASVTIASNGSFSIGDGILIEGRTYRFVLTTSATSTTPSLNSGWTFVGEDLDTTGNDGSPNGELTVTPGLTHVSTLRFGVNHTACYKPGNFSSAGLPTNVGISSLRMDNSANWPMVREGAWIALESNTKGFVLNRLSNAQIQAIPSSNLVVGMMVYNTSEDCLQINVDGTATGWNCFETQTCPDQLLFN